MKNMIKKDLENTIFRKTSLEKEDKLNFKVRKGLISKEKEKENPMNRSLNQAKALNILKKTKKFDSP